MTGDQEFLVTDVLRLQVQDGWPDPLPNLIFNHSGIGGAWGWRLTTLTRLDDFTLESTAGGLHLEAVEVVGAGVGLAWWELGVPAVAAGTRQIRGAVTRVAVGGAPTDLTARVEFYPDPDDSVAIIGSVEVDLNANGVFAFPATDVPADTALIRFVITLTGAEGDWVEFKDAVLMFGTAGDIAASDPLSDPPWTDILGSAATLEIERDEMNLGTLSATLYDANLDPATQDLIRPGKRVRLQALVDGDWESVFTGKADNPSSVYEVRDPFLDDVKRVQIKLVASDAVADLVNSPRPEGVATFADLPYVLLDTGVPYNINGSGAALDFDDVIIAGYNESANAVDQVVITRDSVLGYAWIDRGGVLQAWDRDELSAVAALTIDEDHYSDLNTDWDVNRTFNTLKVELLKPDGTSDTYGPYTDDAARREWRDREATFRVQGIDDADIDAYAAQVLAWNAQPAKRINTVTLPIRSVAELEAYAVLDLYDLVSVSNDLAGVVAQQSRIVTMKHRITIKREGRRLVNRWWLDIGFAPDSTVAVPQVTAKPVVTFAMFRSAMSGGRVSPMTFGATGDGIADDSTALEDCYEAVAEVLGTRGTVEIDRPYGFNVDLLHRGGFTVWQSTPRRIPADGILDDPEPGLIALGADARYRFGQTGDGSGSLNDNPGPVYGLCVDGAGLAGAEGLFYCDAAQSSLYDLMVMNVVDDGIALRIGRSQNLNFFNPQIGPNNGIGVQLKAIAGQQGAGHIVFFGGHIHDNTTGIQINGTAGDFFPPHDNVFNSTLIESGRIADQPIRVAIEALAGLATQFNDVNVTYGAQVDPIDNPVELDCSVLINNPAFPGYSTVVGFRGGTIGGGINKVTDGIRIKQDLAGAANKLLLEGDPGFANVENMICVDGDHGADPDFADPIVDISSLHEITGVTQFSRVINSGTRLNHGHETPVGTRYELPDGISNGEIQNPVVVKHASEAFSRLSLDWNAIMRWHDPATGAVVGSILRNGASFGTSGAFLVGGAFGRFSGSQNLAANAVVNIDNLQFSSFYIIFTAAGADATAVNITNTSADRMLRIGITGHAGGGNVITWPAGVVFTGGVGPQPIAGVTQFVELVRVGANLVEVSRSHP